MPKSTGTPKIVIDARMLGPVPHGIARYVKSLAFGLNDLHASNPLPYEPVFLVPAASDAWKTQLPPDFQTVPVRAPFLNPRELIEIPFKLRKVSPALYHSTSFSSLLGIHRAPSPWLVTIHDLNHLHFGSLRDRVYYRAVLRNFALGARRVITVSEFSRSELASWLGVPSSRIEIAQNAIDTLFCDSDLMTTDETLRKYHLQSRGFFLFISHHSKAHKNSSFLVRSYLEAKRRAPGLPPLVLNASKQELAEHHLPTGLSGVICLGKLADAELKALIEQSRAVLFPSVYEGFGLPPLEAAMQGARVLVSDIPPHREALVDFSPPQLQWLDPHDSESWIQAIARLKGPEAAQTEYLASPEQIARAASRFSTRTLAERMDQIYRSVLELG